MNRRLFCVWVTTDECQPSSFADLLIISVGHRPPGVGSSPVVEAFLVSRACLFSRYLN